MKSTMEKSSPLWRYSRSVSGEKPFPASAISVAVAVVPDAIIRLTLRLVDVTQPVKFPLRIWLHLPLSFISVTSSPRYKFPTSAAKKPVVFFIVVLLTDTKRVNPVFWEKTGMPK